MTGTIRAIALAGLINFILAVGPAVAADIKVYKSPWCGCCSAWVKHMETAGHEVQSINIENLSAIKKMAGVPENMQSCHTAFVDGYVIEGHVPADDVERLLTERPKARGLAVPGMPMGSPGMEGPTKEAYDVILFGTGTQDRIYSKR